MRRLTKTLFGALALFYFQAAGGVLPVYQREVTTPAVTDSLGTVPYPFLGGIDSPKDALVDIDNDGDMDLFILRTDGQLNFFRNTGTAASYNFVLEKESLIDTSCGTWFRLADINGDGKKDLFCDNNAAGMRYYQNTTANLAQTPVFSLNSTAFQCIVSEFNALPAFADLDNDGDLDFFPGRLVGSLAFYRNDGTPASPNFVHVLHKDTVASEISYNGLSTFETAPPCTANVASLPPLRQAVEEGLYTPRGNPSAQNAQGHGANCIDFADVDGDGDQDFFWGDIGNINLYYFKNQGTLSTPDSVKTSICDIPPFIKGVHTFSNLVKTTNCYLPFSSFGFNTPSFGDLDGDGDLDLLVGTANAASLKDNLVFLRNTGTPSSPSFSVVTKNFLRGIDVGGFAFPQMVDIDGDCDLDLITGSSTGHLFFFQNVGTGGNPAFQLVSTNFGGIAIGGFAPVAIPMFADIDADGDWDLFVGKDDGTVSFYRNTGSRTNPIFSLITTQYLGLTVNTNPVFCFGDIDADGDLDLFVGEWRFNGLANVRFYRNQGTAQVEAFALEEPQLIPPASRIQTLPALADYDGDGDLDLFVGVLDGSIQLFQNDGTPDTFSFTPVAGRYAGIDVVSWAAPNFSDLDGDGDLDLLVGTEEGGVFFYRNTASVSLMKGDVNLDNVVTSPDVVIATNATFLGICFKAPFDVGDLNCDGILSSTDVVLLINLAFLGLNPGC